jgi:hypothetical protein
VHISATPDNERRDRPEARRWHSSSDALHSASRHPPADHAARAFALFQSLQQAFYDPRTGLYHQHRRPSRHETLWPFANAWASICALAGVAHQTGNLASAALDQALATRISATMRYEPPAERERLGEELVLGSVVYRRLLTPVARRLWRVGTVYFDDNV